MNELALAKAWLVTRLTDATLSAEVSMRIWDRKAPEKDPATNESPAYPYVVFHVQASRDVTALGAHRVQTEVLFCVKVYADETTLASQRRAAHRIDALLQAAPATSATLESQTAQITGCSRERAIDGEEVADGVTYSFLGGLYRVYLYA